MPIRVQMPNGTVRPFREGTPKSVIRRAQQDMLADMKASGAYEGFDFSEFENIPRKVMVTAAMPLPEDPSRPILTPPKSVPAPGLDWQWFAPGFPALTPGDPKVGSGKGEFGSNRNRDGKNVPHAGIDVAVPKGTPIISPADGIVVSTSPLPGYGNQIVIDHGGGDYSQFGHMGSIDLKPGDQIKRGDVIGKSGRTGNVPPGAPDQVHFERRKGSPAPRKNGGTVIDPLGPDIRWQGR